MNALTPLMPDIDFAMNEVPDLYARFDQLRSATLEDMLAFQRDNIAGRPKLISIVGDLSRIDVDALAQYGTVTQVQVDDLFVD